MSADDADSDLFGEQQPTIRYLAESALREVMSSRRADQPQTRADWVSHLCEALISSSDTSHKVVVASLLARGVTNDELYQVYVPQAAELLGEMWVADRVSFVDVTVGAGRLQKLFRDRPADLGSSVPAATIPLGQSVLVAIPTFEQHSLGAFVVADNLRRHGIWVHMAVSLEAHEIAELVTHNRFMMIGISVSAPGNIDKTAGLVTFLRAKLDHVPPVVVGGMAVKDRASIERKTGADFAVKSAREAIEKCGLATVGVPLNATEVP